MDEGEDGDLDESGNGTTHAIACVVLSPSCGGGWVAGEGRDRSSNSTRCVSCRHQAGRGEGEGEDKGEGEGRMETRVGEGENSDGTRQAGGDEVCSPSCLHTSAGEGMGEGKGKGKGEMRELRQG